MNKETREKFIRQLKPCPHCGGKGYLEEDSRAFMDGESVRCSFVWCTKCHARSAKFNIKPSRGEAVSKAVAAWNERWVEHEV